MYAVLSRDVDERMVTSPMSQSFSECVYYVSMLSVEID